ncbi:Dpy-30_motif_containing_protein_-_putative [Leishmania infantum]|nr:Dpy-30_motif_containing_protein_-_putative [Leishmania infantum]SUZ43094.1 Dpy-30_motif_containing_protein_-_putative [Leishmania infantum]
MKKVLVLNGDSYVGRHVVRAFHQSYEYEVEITRTRTGERAATAVNAVMRATSSDWLWGQMKGLWDSLEKSLVAAAADAADDSSVMVTGGSHHKSTRHAAPAAGAAQLPTSLPRAGLSAEERNTLPADIQFCVSSIVPKHNDNTEEFRKRLLANDVVIAVLQDDTYEAMCAIRILAGTHYDVEKTFVLVSSAVTWAYTLTSERARARAMRQWEREEERNAFLEELLDAEDEENDDGDALGEGAAAVAEREARRAARRRELEQRLPLSLREPAAGEDEAELRELVPDRVFTDDAYAQRVPHPRFQHWHSLEHLVKRSNTETLHTYVVFAGLPYGAGEGSDMLFGLLRSAWHHQVLPQYGAGVNEIPMIHVQDLASILYKVGSAYDVLGERYMFAVDQGHITQRQLLQAVQARFGGSVQPAVAVSPSVANATAVDLVRLDRLELPPPTSPQELFAAFGNKPCWGDGGALLTALVLSDIQAEPSTVLTMHAEDDWVALDGFLATLDVTCAQFRAAHADAFKPIRALITGPPLSGAETVAALLAQRCRAPCVSRENIVADYKAHVADVRAALRGLLMRRLQRRRARVQARLVRQAAEEKAAGRLAKEEQRRQRREERQQRGDTDDDSGGEEEPDEEGAATEGESEVGGAASGVASGASLISIFLPTTTKSADSGSDDEEEVATQPQQQQQPLRPIALVVNEAYIRGAADADADGDEEGGAGIDEEQEEDEDEEEGGNWLAQLDAQDEAAQAEMQEDRELLPPVPLSAAAGDAALPLLALPPFAARSRGRAFARDVDRQELRCIAALRQEYLLGLKVLALKVSAEGRLPRPPPTPAASEDNGGYNDEDGRGGTSGGSDEGSDEGSSQDSDEEGDEEVASDGTLQASPEGRNDAAEEDEEEDDDYESADPGDDTNPLLAIDPADDSSAYLDCALAFMCRWRLRQSDCRCQGYILSDFPQTLAQAVLCFRANGAELEDAELRRQRALAPLLARSDDHAAEDSSDADGEDGGVLAPIDADFPLPDIANMEEEELLALERAHRRGRGPAGCNSAVGEVESMDDLTEGVAASGDTETVIEPVDESLFVDHVVALQADPAVLRATMDALQTNLVVAAEQQASSTSQSGAGPSAQGAAAIGSAEAALAALRASLHTTPYVAQLEWYMDHHTATSPPTQSLLSWLSAITTTPALGVQHARVIVPLSTSDDAADVEDADGVAVTTMEAPPTTRTAQMHFMPMSVLSTEEVKACWCAASERKAQDGARAAGVGMDARMVANRTCGDECGSALVDAKLPVALMRLAPLCWTGAAAPQSPLLLSQAPSPSAHTRCPRHSRATSRRTPPPAASLAALAQDLCARIAPVRREPTAAATTTATAAPAASTETDGVSDTSAKTAPPLLADAAAPAGQVDVATASETPADAALKEAAGSISDAAVTVAAGEEERQTRLTACSEAEASQILHELASLRRLQIVESSPDTVEMLELPVETYLMKYVLPNLTPVMTDVVRMRPNDPVSTLADALFERRRRVTL